MADQEPEVRKKLVYNKAAAQEQNADFAGAFTTLESYVAGVWLYRRDRKGNDIFENPIGKIGGLDRPRLQKQENGEFRKWIQ